MSVLGIALLVSTGLAGIASAWLWWIPSAPGSRLQRAAQWCAAAAAAASVAAAGVMMVGLLSDSFAVDYTERVIEPGMPLYYRITSLWAGTEGSLLLWLGATAITAAIFTLTTARRVHARSAAIAAGVLQITVVAFAAVCLVAQPFAVGSGDLVGRPSPLLQDHPAMGVHPPLLYAGFVLLAVPYALAIAAAITGRWDASWWLSVHRWTIAAWVPLTLGIALGAWWSYAVLGWGGYWAWDPVENASLMPWLAATGLLHSVGRTTRRAGALRWAMWMAMLAYVLVLLATFITRSGIVASIHSFSVSPLGPLLLAIVVLATGAAVGCGLRIPWPQHPRESRTRDAALVIHRWGMLAVLVVVFTGSLMPAAIEAISGARVSVGPPWYERVLAPAGLLLLLAMAAGPWFHSRARRGAGLSLAIVTLGLATAAIAIATTELAVATAGGIAAFVIAGTAARALSGGLTARANIGAAVAHTAVALGGVALAASGMTQVSERTVAVGEALEAGGATVVLVSVDEKVEERRTTETARLVLARGGVEAGELMPELRWYHEHDVVLAGPAIRTELLGDVYVTLLGTDVASGTATLRVSVNPMVPWLWVAVGLMVVAVLVAGTSRRGVPRTTAQTAPEQVART